MGIIFNLSNLPELQRVDKQHRRKAILDWRAALWKGWGMYLFELSIFIGPIGGFNTLWHFIVGNTHWPWYSDFIWIVPGSFTAILLRNNLIYLRRRDVLKNILERPEYATC